MQNYELDDVAKEYISKMAEDVKSRCSIDKNAFKSLNVKRGLRNVDGTGVLAGVTAIGSVQGYMMLDGDPVPMPGRLYYRGIEINEIIENHVKRNMFGFEEVCYLLLMGKLPNSDELEQFKLALAHARHMPGGYFDAVLFKSPSRSIMNKLACDVLSLYSFDESPDDVSIENVLRQSIELIARIPIIVANAYNVNRHVFDKQSLYLHVPKDELSTAENLLRMLRPDKKYTEDEAHLLDLALTLHAEHGGGNNSTFTCRSLTSTGTDTYSAISGAINALTGPLHGGANAKVVQMVENIRVNVTNIESDKELRDYLGLILDGKANDGSKKIYGLGHAVYTESDPRQVLLKKYAMELAERHGLADDLHLCDRIERIGLELLAERKSDHRAMCANVDMYAGLVYKMLGIPMDMFTPIFAIARVSGWCAHRIEELLSGNKLVRPGYKAVMPKDAHYIPMDERE